MPAPPRPGTREHTKLRDLIRSRRDFSKRHISARYPAWNESDRIYQLFADPDLLDKEGKKKYPWATSIVVPVTYAIMQTQLAFDLTAFTQRRPVIPLGGTGPEDLRSAKLMEQVLHSEWQTRRMLLDVYTWLLDRRRYGLGILWNSYRRDVSWRTVETPRTVSLLGLTVPIGTTRERQEIRGYQGNDISVVDPFQFWPDPRVSISRLYDGEFVGRTLRRSYTYMQQQEAAGFYYHVDEIPKDARGRRHSAEGGISTGPDDSDRNRIRRLSEEVLLHGDTVDFQERGFVELDEFVLMLRPRDYGLGSSDRPELYAATLANDEIVVRGESFTADHGQLPVAAFEASLDAHSAFNVGDPEILGGLQDHLSWLLNSRLENIRKVLNDMFLVNPAAIEMQDLLQPQPGRLIRLKREFQNMPNAMDLAVKQFEVRDVTASHLQDLQMMLDLAQRTAAAPENMQGVISTRDRTLGEQQMAVSSAQRRLQVQASLAWLQGVVPWTTQRVSNIQQEMDEERFIEVVGDWPRILGVRPPHQFLKIGPKDIQGGFTYDVIDGVIRQSDEILKTWKEMWLEWSQNPFLQQWYNGQEMFRRIAIMSNITDIDEIALQSGAGMPGQMPATTIMPDEQVQRQVEQGNLVPAGGPPILGALGGNGRGAR